MTVAPITFEWTVPAGLPAAGTVRQCFILIPIIPGPTKRAVFFQWSSYAGSGVWSIPEANDPNSQMFCQLGLYVVGIDQGKVLGDNGTYGAYRTEIAAWWDYVKATYGIGPTLSAWLRSRGGMWGNLAADTYNFFDRMAGLAPITDAQSYDPAGIAENYTGDTSNPPAVSDFSAVPSVACPTLPTAAGQSISLLQQNALNDRASAIFLSGIPMYFAYGTADTTVVPSSNILAFQTAYEAAGGTNLQFLEVVGADHATITKTLYQPLIDFMVADNPGATYLTQPILTSPLASAQSIPGGTITVVNQQVTVVDAGTYLVMARAQIQDLSGQAFWIGITQNGALKNEQQTANGTGTQDCVPSLQILNCAAGDVLGCSIYVFGPSTSNYPLTVNGAVTFIQAVLLG
jgi:hypothetical protein